MAMNNDPMADARSSIQSASLHAEQALNSTEPDEIQSHVQESLRSGEQARASLEELLDSTDDERVILHGEQALDAVEEALDQANQALLSSEDTMRDHVEQMSAFAEQALAQIELAMGIEIV